ncbi:MAG TPA: hypothetical protein VMA31_16260 [Bryobacteraceae bacterium]|nr:hypothetical protein [Bryobacteraceae bacterium]
MKTTVEIPDSLFAEAKLLASRQGITLRQLIEEGLRASLKRRGKEAKPFRLKDAAFRGGKGLQRDYTWEEILAMSYEGRGA